MSKYIAEIEFEGEEKCRKCPLTRYGLLPDSVTIRETPTTTTDNTWVKPIPDSVTPQNKPYKNVWEYLNQHWVLSQKEKPIESYTGMIYELLKRNNNNYEYVFHDMLTLFQDYATMPDNVTDTGELPTVTIPMPHPIGNEGTIIGSTNINKWGIEGYNPDRTEPLYSGSGNVSAPTTPSDTSPCVA
jgi:hypothetical protein